MTVSTHTQAVASFSAGATATVTFTAGGTPGQTLVIYDREGTAKTYTVASSTSATAGELSGANFTDAANGLKDCIDHANGHNGTITGVVVVGGSSAVLTLTWSAGGLWNQAHRVITETHTGATVTDFSGGVSGAEDIDGGIVMQGGNIAGSRLTNKSILDTVKGADEYGSKLGTVTGTAHKVGLAVARSVGSPKFAFFPKPTDRTTANCTFLARGLQTKVAGAASTEDIMGVLGQDQGARSIHVHSDDHYQRGSWATLAFNLFRNPTAGDNSETTGLVQSDGTAKSGATNRGTAAIFRNLADQDNARPVSNNPTRAIPGELVFMIDFASWPFAAGEPAGGNYKDYSAITGG